jgi:hypothetical protein
LLPFVSKMQLPPPPIPPGGLTATKIDLGDENKWQSLTRHDMTAAGYQRLGLNLAMFKNFCTPSPKRHGTQAHAPPFSSRAFQIDQEHDLMKHPGTVDLISTNKKLTNYLPSCTSPTPYPRCRNLHNFRW